MNSALSNPALPHRTVIMLAIASAMAACNGGDGSSPSISSNPTLVGGDSPTLATAPRNFTGSFDDTARGFRIDVTFTAGLPPTGDDNIAFTGDDNVSSYFANPFFTLNTGDSASVGDEQSRQAITFVAPGDDGAWYTADDVPGSYVKDTWVNIGDGRTSSKQISYTGAGDDGVWFTTDDVISRYTQHDYPSTNSVLTFDATSVAYSGPGGDGIWFTTDDFVESKYRDSNADSVFYAAGPDGVADNQDDILCTTYLNSSSSSVDSEGTTIETGTTDQVVFNSNAEGCPTGLVAVGEWYRGPSAPYRITSMRSDNKSDSVVYSNPGPDAQWRTADDVVDAHFTSFAPSGFNVPPYTKMQFTFWDNPGADGQWFTADDRIARTSINNDPQWLAAPSSNAGNAIDFNGPGADETWFTDDDIVGGAALYSIGGFFGGWDRVDIFYRDIGADRKMGTSDDNVKDYHVRTCVPQSDDVGLVESFSITGAGPDNTWFTEDDVVANYGGYFVKTNQDGPTPTALCSTFAD